MSASAGCKTTFALVCFFLFELSCGFFGGPPSLSARRSTESTFKSLTRSDLRRWSASIHADSSSSNGSALGKLTLVGAGPGDPELLTLKALKAIRTADLVVADRLVSKEVLDLVKCELRVARKFPGCAEEAQQEIYRWVKEALKQKKNVVRLKIGDPYVFGRGGEEVLEARSWGVESNVIPGVSSVFSAPLLANIPVTHRGVASQVTLGTGYSKDCGTPDISNYHPDRTAVFLMAVGRLNELCQDLVSRGYPGTTPVAVVQSASLPTQRTVKGTVDTIVELSKLHKIRAPATIVVGEVCNVLNSNEMGLIQDCHLSSSEDVSFSSPREELRPSLG